MMQNRPIIRVRKQNIRERKDWNKIDSTSDEEEAKPIYGTKRKIVHMLEFVRIINLLYNL